MKRFFDYEIVMQRSSSSYLEVARIEGPNPQEEIGL
jgi:hypothetical protein